ncbi:LysR substrate binding domain protein [Candidatus Terasakiella magnetica]|uniref:LysR substrate binding domain protein n=1 Tax=Candidatus Terasakiella magnetica TaxID=1867952 RepID=A0A1C3RFA5_9PROT|nr:LysR family transcriptional regulator [Candidatus Terasakiella magnetica]SCA55976.1 LysR substrate binding domain protein [Candidatus Terasakiella magnetica]
MDTASLRLFVLCAEKLNISAAGRSLGMAPAVASARLSKLEHSLGADLLHRSTRKVSLSLEGADFLPYAKEMIAQEEAGRAALGQGNAMVSGTLRFTAPSSFAQTYIAPILPEFLELHPEVNLELQLSDSQFDLIEGSFDLALRNSAIKDSSLIGRKLSNDRRILCAAPSYLEKYGIPQHPDELENHQLIGFKNFVTRLLIGPEETNGQFSPQKAKRRLIIDNGMCQKAATLAGAGISLNSTWIIHQEIKQGKLIQVLPHYEVDDQSALWLLYPKSNVLTAKVRVFIDFLIEKIAKNTPWEQVD